MLIQGSARSERGEILISKYLSLIDSGISAGSILVLTQNAHKRQNFLNEVKKRTKLNFLECPRVYTFFGLVYNTISEYWADIESGIKNSAGVISPHLCGLEISELLMKSAVKETGFADYNSKVNLLHQLFRRNSLITQNSLSDSEVIERSAILKEPFSQDVKKALDIFKRKTLEYRAFDYLRQLNIFTYFYKNNNCFENIEYLILDDADEITNAEFEFLEYLKPRLKDYCIGYDRWGVSRMGFLNADPCMPEKLEKLFNENIHNLDEIKSMPIKASHSSSIRRLDMIGKAITEIENLLKKGVALNEICIVTPCTDSSLKFCFAEKFSENEFEFIFGSEKLVEVPFVKALITLLKLTFKDIQLPASELRSILCKILKIPVKYSLNLISKYNETGEIDFSQINVESERVKTLEELLKSSLDCTLYDKALLFFNAFFSPEFSNQLEKINFFLKQLKDFEEVFRNPNVVLQKIVLTQLENSIISENPPNSAQINENFLIIATAQKIIDLGIKRKYQIWLDVTSPEWVKQDTGTLYNAWVFQKSWNETDFTYETNLKLSEEKTRRQLRKLALLAVNEIYAFSSLFDINGLENTSGIEKYFSCRQKEILSYFKFTPRQDQQPVLDFESGTLAISAVPGAGKTTILLALVVKLLSKKINPENIFVLTYMDSAARNFKERIKKIYPNMDSLPNISTIHGLALRILKENSNYLKIGLDSDFEVCDENQRQGILREILSKLGFEQEDYDKYEKAVSALKLSCAKTLKTPNTPEAKKFLQLFNLYNQALKNRNTLDYDDMLLFSVELLEKNQDVLEYYSDICAYIIEDEAQDSSLIQQKLLSLLSTKHKNLIRCGDLNQSITTTFTNADREGFQRFIENSESVTMNSSQRCNAEIFGLANRLIDYSKKNEFLNGCFFDSKMKPVAGSNPENKNALMIKSFEDFSEERNFIFEKIRQIFAENKNASIALLTRSNLQTAQYEEFLSNCGFTVITRSDSLDRQPVFRLVLNILKFCEHPWQNENVLEFMTTLTNQRLQLFSQNDFDFIKELCEPFILQKSDVLPEGLVQLHWDLNYWLENSFIEPPMLGLKAGAYYYSTEIEKSNVYLIFGLMKKLCNQYKTGLVEKIEEISKKPGLYKFFADEEKDSEQTLGTIKIMTFHKSKGDEFDYVFIPELTKEILPLAPCDIKIKSNLRFIEHIKSLNPAYTPLSENELKQTLAHENMRLLYVAVTRAKKYLYISCAKKYKRYSKIKEAKECELFSDFFECFEEVFE